MGCQSESINCGVVCSGETELLFRFGFEDVEIRQDDQVAYIEGIDGAYSDHNSSSEEHAPHLQPDVCSSDLLLWSE